MSRPTGRPSNVYWQQAWDTAQSRLVLWKSSSTPHPEPRVIRVSQLDAELLDEELVQLLQEPLNKALGAVNPSLRATWGPELGLIIRLALYKFSIWDSGASYGAKLQDIRYRVQSNIGVSLSPSGLPRRTLAAHVALTVLAPYFHGRLRSYALSNSWPDAPSSDRRRRAWNILVRTESAHALLALGSFVVFLLNGRFRTLADRLLGMRFVPSRRLINREVSYEFMNRQMVWHAFTVSAFRRSLETWLTQTDVTTQEFLLFVLPLINARTLRRQFKRIVSRVRNSHLTSIFLGHSGNPAQASENAPQKLGRYSALPVDQCGICFESANAGPDATLAISPNGPIPLVSADDKAPLYAITTPYRTPCGHTYCYYCISERLIRCADDGYDGWECLRCTEVIRNCDRMTGSAVAEEWESDNDDVSLGTASQMSESPESESNRSDDE